METIVTKTTIKPIIEDNIDVSIINKKAGVNTNYFDKKFKEKTNNESILLKNEYKKIFFTKKVNNYYLSKTFDDKTIIFVAQNRLKTYMKNKYNGAGESKILFYFLLRY